MEENCDFKNQIKVLRCSSSTDASKLAGSIYSVYQNNPETTISIRVIGAGSLNQAVKAAIISNKFFAKKGITVGIKPSFQDASENMTLTMTSIELKIIFIKS